MKKLLLFSLLTAVLMSFSFDADAQYRGKKKKKKKKSNDTKSEYFDETGNFASRLWYGADVSFNFGQQNIGGGFTGNSIIFGLTPMVGYKFTDNFSIGPKLGFLYQGGRFNDGFGEDIRLNATDFSIGAFSRFKFLQYYFIHGEIENVWESFATGVVDSDNKLELEREATAHYYLGAGYGSGAGNLGFNLYALYDFSREFTSTNLPIVVRLGLTYKF